MIGISLAYLPGKNIQEVYRVFLKLQEEFSLEACELHMECSQFDSAFYHADDSITEVISELRNKVRIMGMHLPYLDLNPLSNNPLIEQFATNVFKQAINNAAGMGADYVVFHARGNEEINGDRQAELRRWAEKAGELSDIANANSISFCFENADRVRLRCDMEVIIGKVPQVDICLDTGHLFERVRLENTWERLAGRVFDRFLPMASMFGKGMPFYEKPDWLSFVANYSGRIHCIHLHNHNGKTAHCPVTVGKINLAGMLRNICSLTSAPVIVEADYRNKGIEQIRKDLTFLKKVRGSF